IALSTARIHRVRGRPPLLAAGIKSLIHSHSSLVRSLGYIFSFIYPFYTTHEDFSDRLSEKVGDEVYHLRFLNSLEWLLIECGDLDRAMDLNRRGAEGARKRGDHETIANAEL